MAGVFHKAMVWLGLAPDDAYDDYPYDPNMRSGPGPRPGPGGRPPQGQRPPRPGPGPGPGPGQRPQRPMPAEYDYEYEYAEEGFVSPRQPPRPQSPSGAVRPIGGGDGRLPAPPSYGDANPAVRPMRPTSVKPAIIAPDSFDHAKDIADRFKADQPVVMDLSQVDRELARRLIDFSSGICYALGGSMERVRPGGYLLIPAAVEVSDDERRRLAGR